MAALGAWRVWAGNAAACGSTIASAVKSHISGQKPSGRELLRVAPGSCRCRRAGRWTNWRRSRSDGRHEALEPACGPRTANPTRRRRSNEVSLLERAVATRCSQPRGADRRDQRHLSDWRQRAPRAAANIRRVDHEIKQGQVPRPDGRLPTGSSQMINQQNYRLMAFVG